MLKPANIHDFVQRLQWIGIGFSHGDAILWQVYLHPDRYLIIFPRSRLGSENYDWVTHCTKYLGQSYRIYIGDNLAYKLPERNLEILKKCCCSLPDAIFHFHPL